MTKETFMTFYPDVPAAAECYDNISAALQEQGILTPLTLLGALATCRVEVGRNLKPVLEKASGDAYEGRVKNLGNTQVGDGRKYKGRGYIQLTGRYNYSDFANKLSIDLVEKPELALEPKTAARIFALFFKQKKVNLACEKKDWVKVRKLVNGGTNGLADFQDVVGKYLARSGL